MGVARALTLLMRMESICFMVASTTTLKNTTIMCAPCPLFNY